MHKSSMLRMKWFIDTYLKDNRSNGKILDVGSYNVNGSYNELFDKTRYSYEGLDMEEGPNVDLVPKSTYEWNEIGDDNYDVVISGQALEHIEFFWITVAEMVRVTKKGGLICIIAPNGFDEHRYPVDCWRFFTDGMIALARFYGLETLHAHTNAAPSGDNSEWYSEDCADSMIVALKPYEGKARVIDLKNYKCIPGNHEKLNQGMVSHDNYKKNMKAINDHNGDESKNIEQQYCKDTKEERKWSTLMRYIKGAKNKIRTSLKRREKE